MAANNHDPDNQSRWKSRYYEALGEIEEREKAWRDTETLLRQLINQLISAADERHQPLTDSLSELRNGLREGRDVLRLNDIADRIIAQVEELEVLRGGDQARAKPGGLLLAVLEKLQIQDAATRDIRQLKKQLEALRPGEDATAACESFAALVNELLQSGDDLIPARSRKQRLLDMILVRQEKLRLLLANESNKEDTEQTAGAAAAKPGQRLMAPAVGDLLLQLALRLPNTVRRRINFQTLKKHTNRARQRKDLIAIIDVIAQNIDAAYAIEEQPVVILDDESLSALARAVQLLLAQMNPPEDLKPKILELENFVEQDNGDAEGLIHCLNSLSQVVADICGRLSQQRDELEGFVLKLGMYLEDIDVGLQKSGALYNELHQQNMHMDKAVQDELRAIQDAMQSEADRDVTIEKVNKHLESVDFQLQQFQDLEKDHYQNAHQLFARLADKVASLISDSTRLGSQVEGNEKRALHDALTGIPNRSAYEERLALEVARCKRYGKDLSLAVFNVDNFMSINENYGRAAGDRVVKVVAEILSGRIRETDFVARYDGAEFVILMPETSLAPAQQVAEKICRQTEQTAFQFHDIQVEVTISAGVSQYNRNVLVSALFDQADAALDEARRAGGNRAACVGQQPGQGADED